MTHGLHGRRSAVDLDRDGGNHLPVVDINDTRVLKLYAEIEVATQQAGRPLGKNDLWIAACAASQAAELVTCDKDASTRLGGRAVTTSLLDPAG